MKQVASRWLRVCLKQNRSKTEPRTRTRTPYSKTKCLPHLGAPRVSLALEIEC